MQKHPFRTLLVELSWPAVKKKDSFLRDKYFRLRSRIGPKPAIYAIAHRMAKAIFHIVKEHQDYLELGGQYLNELNQAAKLRRLKNHAQKLGYSLTPLAEA